MWDMIYAFGIGISFSVGVVFGAALCRMATKEGRKEELEMWNKHRAEVEKRIGLSVIEHGRIADALAYFVDKDQGEIG